MPKKKPGSVHTARNGSRYKILANGQARFISGPRKRKAKRKGGSVSVGGSARKRKGGSARVGGSARRKRGGGFGKDVRNFFLPDIGSIEKYKGGGLGLGKKLRGLNPGVYDAIGRAGHFMLH